MAKARVRKGGTKSRNGCPTCRMRHVKCDETRPHCQRCVVTGRKCEGFPDDTLKEPITFAPLTTLSSFPLRNTSLISEIEAQHLNAFRHLFVVGLSGFGTSPRWTRLVLKAVHEEPAVRHAAIALSALQLPDFNLQVSASQPLPTHFALQQYGKAVKCFQELLSRKDIRSIEAALMCSILCVCFEVLEGSHLIAKLHLDNGLKVVSTIEVDADLSQAFARLDVQASSYISNREPVLAQTSSNERLATFIDLDGAEAGLNQNLNELWRFLRCTANHYRYRDPSFIPLSALIQAHNIQLRLEQWNNSFCSFMFHAQIQPQTKEEWRIKILRIYFHTATIIMAGCLYLDEMVYDKFDDAFQSIIDLASELHKESTRTSTKTFSMEMGIIYPLFVTAVRCRIVNIRARAIELLLAVPHPEGVWNGQIEGRVAQQVKMIEEEGLDELLLCTQRVPEFRRVHGTGTDIDVKNRCSSYACTLRPNGLDGEWEVRKGFINW